MAAATPRRRGRLHAFVVARPIAVALAGALPFGCSAAPQERPHPAAERVRSPSWLGRQFELDESEKRGTWRLNPHWPNYFTARYTTEPNQASSPDPDLDVLHGELKFQISVKTKLIEELFSERVDLWAAYTQQSYWQIWQTSGPFRETNYEPEAFVAGRVDVPVGPLQWRMVSFGFNHHSNGQGNSLSRTWNRLIAQFGFERGGFDLLLRPWWRIPENEANDENPDIEDYLGHGDLVARYSRDGWILAMTLRNNLQSDPNRSGVRFQIAAPLPWTERAKLFGEYFTGYGESLSSYDHKEQSFVIGIAVSDWN